MPNLQKPTDSSKCQMDANKTSKAIQKQSNKNKGTIFTPNDDNDLNAYGSPLPSSTENCNLSLMTQMIRAL